MMRLQLEQDDLTFWNEPKDGYQDGLLARVRSVSLDELLNNHKLVVEVFVYDRHPLSAETKEALTERFLFDYFVEEDDDYMDDNYRFIYKFKQDVTFSDGKVNIDSHDIEDHVNKFLKRYAKARNLMATPEELKLEEMLTGRIGVVTSTTSAAFDGFGRAVRALGDSLTSVGTRSHHPKDFELEKFKQDLEKKLGCEIDVSYESRGSAEPLFSWGSHEPIAMVSSSRRDYLTVELTRCSDSDIEVERALKDLFPCELSTEESSLRAGGGPTRRKWVFKVGRRKDSEVVKVSIGVEGTTKTVDGYLKCTDAKWVGEPVVYEPGPIWDRSIAMTAGKRLAEKEKKELKLSKEDLEILGRDVEDPP